MNLAPESSSPHEDLLHGCDPLEGSVPSRRAFDVSG